MALCAKLLNSCRTKLFIQQSYVLNLVCSRTFAVEKADKGPKRPLGPFLTFFVSVKGELSQKYPDKRVPDLAKIAGELYKNLGDQEKQKLSQTYEADLKVYKKAREAWMQQFTKEEQEKMALKKKEDRALKEVSKPHKPASGYTLFIKQRWDTLSYGERSEGSIIEKGREFAKEWSSLSKEQKQKYDNEVEKAEYNVKLLEWEKTMMKKGIPSLVRASSLKQIVAEQKPASKKKTPAKAAPTKKDAAKKATPKAKTTEKKTPKS